MPGALLTDLYELNMAASYLRRGLTGDATFSLYVRTLPPTRGFLVAAGLEACLDFLESLRFDDDELRWLGDVAGYDDTTLDAFAALRFTGDVWAVPEGRVIFAGEPLLEVTAPLPEAQLVETLLLNQITTQTMLASKAARCRLAARGTTIVDFAFRRTHGVDAAMACARAGAMVGFDATSNVEAARRWSLPAAGTMAHSYIEAFPTELDAFRAFAEDFPDRSTFLVDTYDTLTGVRRAIEVIREAGLSDRAAIRLDSGDLGALAVAARSILDDAGLRRVRIFASGGLDELAIDDLLSGGAPIDAFGVGTLAGVSADAPFLDTVYKLVSYAGRPVLKRSTEKETLPGAKQVFRSPDATGDLVARRAEDPPSGWQPLLQPVMASGTPLDHDAGLENARARFERDVATLPESARRLRDPRPPPIRVSPALQRLTDEVRGSL